MISIDIYIKDSEKISENEMMGYEKNDHIYSLVPFYFKEDHLSGYWEDVEIDTQMGTINIIFYVGGSSFCTPYSKETETILKNCLLK
jgi:hypothetical protein